MTHAELTHALRTLGWTEKAFDSGTVDFYLTDGPVDRMVRMIPSDPTHAMCADRDGGRSVTSIEEAATWARACMPNVL